MDYAARQQRELQRLPGLPMDHHGLKTRSYESDGKASRAHAEMLATAAQQCHAYMYTVMATVGAGQRQAHIAKSPSPQQGPHTSPRPHEAPSQSDWVKKKQESEVRSPLSGRVRIGPASGPSLRGRLSQSTGQSHSPMYMQGRSDSGALSGGAGAWSWNIPTEAQWPYMYPGEE